MDQKKETIAILRQLRAEGTKEKVVVEWIDRAILLTERLMAMDARLPRVFHGAGRGETYARMCHERQLYALATELWSITFEVEPALLERQPDWYIDYAVRSAALAGCGKGKDQPLRARPSGPSYAAKPLPGSVRRSLPPRRPRTEIRLKPRSPYSVQFKVGKKPPTSPAFATRRPWPNFPNPERRNWQALWAEVEALERRLRAGPT